MNHITFKAAIAALALLATACAGRNANSSMAVKDPNAPDTVDGLNPAYKIIYNLPEEEFVQTDTAANAFKFIDANNTVTNYIDSDNIGPTKFKGYEAFYSILVANCNDGNMKIEYIALPDRRVKCVAEGWAKYLPRMTSGLDLAADSAVRIMGYPIRLTYTDDEGNRYNQVLRVNLYPTRREAADSAIAHRAPGVPYHPQPGL